MHVRRVVTLTTSDNAILPDVVSDAVRYAKNHKNCEVELRWNKSTILIPYGMTVEDLLNEIRGGTFLKDH